MAAGICPNCATENPERARFCMSCGTTLAPSCPSCGAENPPEAKFCIECGSSLTAQPADAAGTAPAPTAATSTAAHVPAGPVPAEPEELPEERRKATVLFADLSGYTAVAERMDPEAVKSLVDRSLRRLGQEVARYGGRVDKYIGDNVMAVFGAPVAHEDDPERAVRAGLAMQAAMGEINERFAAEAGVSFMLRVGINSGEVLAGKVGDEYTVMGDAVNVAARLQAAARQGSVTVGEITHRLTRGVIRVRDSRAARAQGQVRAGARLGGGAAARPGRRAPRRAGRDAADRPRRRGRAAGVAVRARRRRGPAAPGHRARPGGRRQVAPAARADRRSSPSGSEEPALREGRCPAYGSGIAYWALGEIMRGQFEILDTDDPEAAWAKLRQRNRGPARRRRPTSDRSGSRR